MEFSTSNKTALVRIQDGELELCSSIFVADRKIIQPIQAKLVEMPHISMQVHHNFLPISSLAIKFQKNPPLFAVHARGEPALKLLFAPSGRVMSVGDLWFTFGKLQSRKMSTGPSESFYGCPLPENLLDYRSSESRIRLCRTLQTGYAAPFLSLSSCYNTQSQLTYCGLSTLSIILNSLQIDPRRRWKTITGWYTDKLLDKCVYKDGQKESGTTLEEFVYLAECNGANATVVRPNNSIAQLEKFVQSLERVCTGGEQPSDKNNNDEIPTELMAISYSREAVGQFGGGHYSPVAALDRETNSVLMLDTARYKYPPHWIPVELIFQAMLPIDVVTGKGRGYIVLEAKDE